MIFSDILAEYGATVFFYFAIMCVSSLLAKASYQYTNSGVKTRFFLFACSFLVLVCFLGFANNGTDYNEYSLIFSRSLDATYWRSTRIEKGFLLFNAIIRFFTPNFAVFHFVWAVCILLLIYSTIWKNRDIINPGWAILAYTTTYMLQGLDLMRMYLAIAIIFWGFRYIVNQKYLSSFITNLVAFSVHKSAICIMLPFLIWVLSKKKGHYFIKSLVIASFFYAIYYMRGYLFAGDFLGYAYTSNQTGSIGIIWIVYHLPVFVLFLYYIKRKTSQDEIVNSLFIFLCVSAGMWVLSYFVQAMGRATFYFTYPFVILPQYVLLSDKRRNYINGITSNRPWYVISYMDLVGLGMILYYFFRAYMYLGYFVTDGVQIYTTIFS